MPSLAVSYGVFGVFVAALSIWAGIAVSARSSDPRVATQLSVLASAPLIAVTTVISVGGVHVGFGPGLGHGYPTWPGAECPAGGS